MTPRRSLTFSPSRVRRRRWSVLAVLNPFAPFQKCLSPDELELYEVYRRQMHSPRPLRESHPDIISNVHQDEYR